MTTRITSPFVLMPVDGAFVANVLAAAGIVDCTVQSCEQTPAGITIESSRHLTAEEEAAVKAVLAANIFQITALAP